METKFQFMNVKSTFLTGTIPLSQSLASAQRRPTSTSLKAAFFRAPPFKNPRRQSSKSNSASTQTYASTATLREDEEDIESLFSNYNAEQSDANQKRGNKNPIGASSISSGVRLENVSKSYKGVTVLRNINWEVKRGEKVGLVGVNGAGKTTQLRIISGLEEPDSGNVIKAKNNMKIAFLNQEFEVLESRSLREELLSAFEEEMEVAGRLEKVHKAMEKGVDDLELMGRLLDEFDLLQRRAQAVDLDEVDVKISKLMPDLGFAPDDADKHSAEAGR